MKKLPLLLVTLLIVSTAVKAQCPANVKYTSAKMEMYDSTMKLMGSHDVVTVFETNEKGFTATQQGDEEIVLHGDMKSSKCDWQELNVKGKMVMICDITDPHETVENATVTIEAVDGKLTITMKAKEYADRVMRFVVDKYEPVN